MNLERHRLVIERITNDRRSWRQDRFHCISSTGKNRHCYGGWAEVLSRGPEWEPSPETLELWRTQWDDIGKVRKIKEEATSRAMAWLSLTDEEARYLFHSDRTLEELASYEGEPK